MKITNRKQKRKNLKGIPVEFRKEVYKEWRRREIEYKKKEKEEGGS